MPITNADCMEGPSPNEKQVRLFRLSNLALGGHGGAEQSTRNVEYHSDAGTAQFEQGLLVWTPSSHCLDEVEGI